MTRQITLVTPQHSFEALHQAADSRKLLIRISREALAMLLTDHSALINACKAAGIRVVEPTRRQRPALKKA